MNLHREYFFKMTQFFKLAYYKVLKKNFQRYNEFTKYLEAPLSEQWTGLAGNGYSNTPATLWRQPRNSKSILPLSYQPAEETCGYSENWRDHEAENGIGGAIVTPHGTILLRLHNKIRVDMTIDRAIRVINFKVILTNFHIKN